MGACGARPGHSSFCLGTITLCASLLVSTAAGLGASASGPLASSPSPLPGPRRRCTCVNATVRKCADAVLVFGSVHGCPQANCVASDLLCAGVPVACRDRCLGPPPGRRHGPPGDRRHSPGDVTPTPNDPQTQYPHRRRAETVTGVPVGALLLVLTLAAGVGIAGGAAQAVSTDQDRDGVADR